MHLIFDPLVMTLGMSSLRDLHFGGLDLDLFAARVDREVLRALDQDAVGAELDPVAGPIGQDDLLRAMRVVDDHQLPRCGLHDALDRWVGVRFWWHRTLRVPGADPQRRGSI